MNAIVSLQDVAPLPKLKVLVCYSQVRNAILVGSNTCDTIIMLVRPMD